MYIFWSIRAAVWLPDFDFVFCAQRFNPCCVSPVLHQPSLARKKRSIRAFPAGLARDVRLHEQRQVRVVVQETKQLVPASSGGKWKGPEVGFPGWAKISSWALSDVRCASSLPRTLYFHVEILDTLSILRNDLITSI